MVYHVIIALNSVGKRKVGQIISTLEQKGLELVEIRKKITHSRVVEFPNMKQLILQYQLNELDAMVFYRRIFSELVLKKKLTHFFRNYVELLFENEEKIIDSNELWEACRQAFGNDRKFPIMFVITTSGENGFNGSFFPEDFELDAHDYFNPRTLIPLGE
jgi:nucleoside diphosphate kinase